VGGKPRHFSPPPRPSPVEVRGRFPQVKAYTHTLQVLANMWVMLSPEGEGILRCMAMSPVRADVTFAPVRPR
jgi:hypothetical protein